LSTIAPQRSSLCLNQTFDERQDRSLLWKAGVLPGLGKSARIFLSKGHPVDSPCKGFVNFFGRFCVTSKGVMLTRNAANF
jgi:hypothetical protein